MTATIAEFLNNIDEYKTDKQEHFTLVVQEQDEVTYGFDKDCDIQYCIDNNIPVYDRKAAGGTIVHAKGSIGINYIYSHDKYPSFLSQDFIKDLLVYLQEKGLNVELDGNDILADGYKVASCAENNFPPDYRWCNIVVLISITQNIDLIKKVCKKPMHKVPKALSEYGITTDEMVQFAQNWFSSKRENERR